jgi:hypothetical protein
MRRVALILLAAAVVAAVAWVAVEYLPALSREHLEKGFLGFRGYRRRDLEPRLGEYPKLLIRASLSIIGAFAIRKLWFLHL